VRRLSGRSADASACAIATSTLRRRTAVPCQSHAPECLRPGLVRERGVLGELVPRVKRQYDAAGVEKCDLLTGRARAAHKPERIVESNAVFHVGNAERHHRHAPDPERFCPLKISWACLVLLRRREMPDGQPGAYLLKPCLSHAARSGGRSSSDRAGAGLSLAPSESFLPPRVADELNTRRYDRSSPSATTNKSRTSSGSRNST
jgi:hypothetical protein